MKNRQMKIIGILIMIAGLISCQPKSDTHATYIVVTRDLDTIQATAPYEYQPIVGDTVFMGVYFDAATNSPATVISNKYHEILEAEAKLQYRLYVIRDDTIPFVWRGKIGTVISIEDSD